MNDFLINTGVPVTLYSNMLTFRDCNKPFKLDEDLLKRWPIINSVFTILTHRIGNFYTSLEKKEIWY